MQDKNISIQHKTGSNNCKTKMLHNIVDNFLHINVIEIVTSYENFQCRM